ncbi:MAG TPA: S1 family peptidase [Kofleriaceae bacterium]|nr:S1 family peptidase [Kofleriaceae bacterium]
MCAAVPASKGRMTTRTVAVSLALGGLMAAACADAPIGSDRAAIIGGAIDSGDPAVVMVEVAGGLCSGVLISPRVVMTAAHCARPGIDLTEPGVVRVGTRAPWDDTIAVAAIHVHRAYRAVGDGPDLALLRLERAAAPAPLAVRAASPVGLPSVRVVGFGLAAAGDPATRGVKREGALPITGVDDEVLLGGGAVNSCEGDSGGPGLDGDERVAAIVSAGDLGCAGTARLQRLDRHAALIAEVIAAWDGRCARDGACVPGCTPFADPDCDPCGLDGTCVEACPRDDLDCPISGQPEPGPAADDGGCRAGGGAGAGAIVVAALAAIGAGAAGGLRRRRRASALRTRRPRTA